MIEFTRAEYDAIVERAEEGQPYEICGVLGGEYDEETTRVETAEPAENVADDAETRYYIDPEEQLEIVEAIESDGDDVVGFYHSHPAGPTVPSETDADRATWPGVSYVIVALDGYPYVGSWRWNAEEAAFEQETVRVAGE